MLTRSRHCGSFMADNDSDRRRWIRALGIFSVLVSDLLAYSAAGVGLGYAAWHYWGWPWWILIVTSLAGLTMAFYRLYKISQKDWDSE